MSYHRRHRSCYSCDKEKVSKPKNNNAKNVLDIRIVPGDPHGAWVECYNNTFDEDAQKGIAEHHAVNVSQKCERLRKEKEDKLKQFQEEVSKRVFCLQKLKRQQLQMKSIKNIEDEQNVILQRTLGLKVPYRGTVEDLQALNKELLKSCIIPCSVNKQLIRSEVEKSNELLLSTCSEVQSQTSRAKKSLLTKKLDVEDTTCLPGGKWSPMEKPSDNLSIEVYPPKHPPIVNRPVGDTWTGCNQIKTHLDGSEDYDINSVPMLDNGCDEKIEQMIERLDIKEDACCENEDEEDEEVKSKSNFEEQLISTLQRNLIHNWCNIVHQETEQGKNQKKIQYWKYRKIFMDIERDQVQERRRKEEHKKRIMKLKIIKERQREHLEEQLTEFAETTMTSTAMNDNLKNTGMSDENYQNKYSGGAHTCDDVKEKEMYRYIDALRAVAKERLTIRNITVPPLCQCGPTLWDSHPDMCANNCIFYKNPNAYIRALTTILSNNRD